MPTKITPERAIIALNRIRNANDTRNDAVDMAITAINRCMVARKPDNDGFYSPFVCRECTCMVRETFAFCPECGQKIDWVRDSDATD